MPVDVKQVIESELIVRYDMLYAIHSCQTHIDYTNSFTCNLHFFCPDAPQLTDTHSI